MAGNAFTDASVDPGTRVSVVTLLQITYQKRRALDNVAAACQKWLPHCFRRYTVPATEALANRISSLPLQCMRACDAGYFVAPAIMLTDTDASKQRTGAIVVSIFANDEPDFPMHS